jgi:adsorption protein B
VAPRHEPRVRPGDLRARALPRDWQHAIRQKSRWIVGIVFQGTSNLGWSRTGALNYFLWRDRRGLFAYLLSFLVNLLLLVLLAMWLVT